MNKTDNMIAEIQQRQKYLCDKMYENHMDPDTFSQYKETVKELLSILTKDHECREVDIHSFNSFDEIYEDEHGFSCDFPISYAQVLDELGIDPEFDEDDEEYLEYSSGEPEVNNTIAAMLTKQMKSAS